MAGIAQRAEQPNNLAGGQTPLWPCNFEILQSVSGVDDHTHTRTRGVCNSQRFRHSDANLACPRTSA
eukprot:457263-Pelagomonas_calceolata.AAC.1